MISVCSVAGRPSSVHTKKVIHRDNRDIKPQNIVRSPDGKGIGKLALIDWGLAVSPEVGKRGLYLGTPAFMSVSCLSGDGKLFLSWALV